MISLRTHNVMDYVAGVFLVLSPFIAGFSDIPAARNLFLVLGFGLIGYSSLTRYYYSIAKVIPVRVHMTMDVLAGLLIILGPGIFNYRDLITDGQFAFHVIVGLSPIALVLFTNNKTRDVVLVRGGIDDSDRPDIRRVA